MKALACEGIFHMWTINSHILLLARVGLPQSWPDIPLVASKTKQKFFYLPSPSIYHSFSSPSQSSSWICWLSVMSPLPHLLVNVPSMGSWLLSLPRYWRCPCLSILASGLLQPRDTSFSYVTWALGSSVHCSSRPFFWNKIPPNSSTFPSPLLTLIPSHIP